MRKNIIIEDQGEKDLIEDLKARTDIKAERIKKLLALPDLTKKENSPVKILVDQIIKLPRFADFDLVDFPRIVTVQDNFDLLNTPKEHTSRRETDTYYVTDKYVLRTQMTVMWSFYLKDPEVYNGWAFGFGDRLAMIKMGIPDIRILWSEYPRITSQFKDINSKYKEVSKYPETSRDISFVIDKNINLNNYYEIVRDFAENLIEEVKLIDSYEDD